MDTPCGNSGEMPPNSRVAARTHPTAYLETSDTAIASEPSTTIQPFCNTAVVRPAKIWYDENGTYC
jgi:hypothetical protein